MLTATFVAASATADPIPRAAEPPPPEKVRVGPGIREHDGFFARGGIGFGGFQASMTGTGVNVCNAGVCAFETVSLSGGALATGSELALGGTPFRGVVVGGGFFTNLAAGSLPGTRAGGRPIVGSDSALILYAPFVDYYFDPSAGWHLEGAAGLALIAGGSGGTGITGHTGAGGGAMVGFGNEWWIGEQWSVGGLARMTAGFAKSTKGAEWHDTALSWVVMIEATYH
jgi:hypothetical protein